MEQPTEQTFRYLDDAMALSYAVGLRPFFTEAGVVLEFFTNDPTGAATFIVTNRVLTGEPVLIELAHAVDRHYGTSGGGAAP